MGNREKRFGGCNWEGGKTAVNGLRRMKTRRCVRGDICERHYCVDDMVEWDPIGQDAKKSRTQALSVWVDADCEGT